MDAEHDGQDAERIVTLPVAEAPKASEPDPVREALRVIRMQLFKLEVLLIANKT